LFQALGDFRLLVDTATTISFLIAPLIAALNFRLVMADKVGRENAPNTVMKIISYLGLIFLFAFSAWFVITL
jgi:Mn2+/Fe2+ NRAMP family transporter